MDEEHGGLRRHNAVCPWRKVNAALGINKTGDNNNTKDSTPQMGESLYFTIDEKKIYLYRNTTLIDGEPYHTYDIYVDSREKYTLATDKGPIECRFWELHQMIKEELEENPKFGGKGLFFE
jgi:hypothetical protein